MLYDLLVVLRVGVLFCLVAWFAPALAEARAGKAGKRGKPAPATVAAPIPASPSPAPPVAEPEPETEPQVRKNTLAARVIDAKVREAILLFEDTRLAEAVAALDEVLARKDLDEADRLVRDGFARLPEPQDQDQPESKEAG